MKLNKQKSESIIKNYYKVKKLENKLKFELGLLEEHNEKLKEYQDWDENNKELRKRIENNNKKIIDKQIKINDIINEIIEIQYIIESLDDEEKKIVELKYKKKETYEFMEREIGMSKATITRRLKKIFNKLNEEIIFEEYNK